MIPHRRANRRKNGYWGTLLTTVTCLSLFHDELLLENLVDTCVTLKQVNSKVEQASN